MNGPVRYHVAHTTTYGYERPMSDGYTLAHLLPRPTPHQVVEAAEVAITPEPDERAEHFDVFGNRVLQLGVHRSHDALTLAASSDVVVEPLDADELDGAEAWEAVRAKVGELRGADALTVRPFAGDSLFVSLDLHGAELRGDRRRRRSRPAARSSTRPGR